MTVVKKIRNLISNPKVFLVADGTSAEANLGYSNTEQVRAVLGLNNNVVKTINSTSYDISPSDNGSIIEVNYNLPVSINLPNNITNSFHATIIQKGSGAIRFIPKGGSVLRHKNGHNQSDGIYSNCNLYVIGNSNDQNVEYILSGDTSISRPLELAVVGSIDTEVTIYSLYILDSYAYLNYGTGFMIFDFTTPTNPQLIGNYTAGIGANFLGLYVVGNYVYLANMNFGLEIVDVTVPSNPIFRGNYRTGFVSSQTFAFDVKVVGDYAYVVDINRGLNILNISDPVNPNLVNTPNNSTRGKFIHIVGNYAYIVDSSNLTIVNITNPNNTITTYTTFIPKYSNEDISGIYVFKDFAYIANNTRGLSIYNVSNPSAPYYVSNFHANREVRDVKVVSDYAYLATSAGLVIVDVKDPLNPKYAGINNINSNLTKIQVVNGSVCALDFTSSKVDIITTSTFDISFSEVLSTGDINVETLIFRFVVTRTGNIKGSASVKWDIEEFLVPQGTASDSRFTFPISRDGGGTLIFNPEESSKIIQVTTVPLNGSTLDKVTVLLSNPINSTINVSSSSGTFSLY